MARSRSTFSKRENEKKKQKRKEDKQQKREEKKANTEAGKSLDDMIAYVDEFGNITDTPPDPDKKKKEVKAASIEVSIPKQEDEPDTSKRGVVTYYDSNKNFGFIAQEETQDRFFFHESNLIEPVQEGDKVTFIAKKGMKGMDAVEVKRAT